MNDREKVIKGLKCCRDCFELDWDVTCATIDCPYKGERECLPKLCSDALDLLKEQGAVVRCKDCENWIPGYITDHDDFIPPKCGKYQQMVGHSAADYCSLAEQKESR